MDSLGAHDTDDTTGETRARVARRLAQLDATEAEIVHIGVHDHGAANDRMGSVQLDEMIGEVELGDTVGIGRHVAQIADTSKNEESKSVNEKIWLYRAKLTVFRRHQVRHGSSSMG